MKFFEFFRTSGEKKSADQAKERLQILLAHDRAQRGRPDFLPMLQKELVEVICRYIEIDSKGVEVKFETSGEISTLEVNIEFPVAARQN